MTTEEQLVFSDLPVSPCSVLQEEIEARGISAGQLSSLMGRPIALVLDILDERSAVTPEIADDIENALGIKAYFWLNLEAGFRATLAHNELVARQGPDHTCHLGEDCPSRQTYQDDQDDEDELTPDEQPSPANIRMDEGEYPPSQSPTLSLPLSEGELKGVPTQRDAGDAQTLPSVPASPTSPLQSNTSPRG